MLHIVCIIHFALSSLCLTCNSILDNAPLINQADNYDNAQNIFYILIANYPRKSHFSEWTNYPTSLIWTDDKTSFWFYKIAHNHNAWDQKNKVNRGSR